MSIRGPLKSEDTVVYSSDADEADFQAIAAEQRSELMAAKAVESDLDLAFNIQLQEAINASLSFHQNQPASSSSLPETQLNSQQLDDDDFLNFTDLQSDELLKLEQKYKDHAISEMEFRKVKNDYHRMVHDRQVALEISRIPEDDWEEWGDDFEKPFGEGCSKSVNNEIFRIYFKGLLEKNLRSDVVLGGIGVAVCDSRDNLLFELTKPLLGNWTSRQCVEIRALIAGLNAALELDLKRVVFYCDYHPVFNYVTGRWSAKQQKVSSLLKQVNLLRDKFTYCQPSLVARNDIKFVFKLAREAIVSQVNRTAGSSASKNLRETCVICFEETDITQIFSIDDCMHRYCFSCMKQHVEVKLLHGMLPKCPHEGCNTELKIDACSKFLTPRLIEIMTQRIKEASIPVTQKVYCPFPKCSALMSKGEVLEHSKRAIIGAEKLGHMRCLKCNGPFCINCKVPWHKNMTCADYKRRNPYPQPEEAKLKNLAVKNLWRQCVKCNHMIELAAGCYHMTCRCGHEFCYNCGAEWKNKHATCSCPLWDEEFILDDDEEEEEEEEEDDDDDDDKDEDDEDDEYYYSSDEDFI